MVSSYRYGYGYDTGYDQPSYSSYQSAYDQPAYDYSYDYGYEGYDPYGYDPGYTLDQQPAYEYEYQAPPPPAYETQTPAYQTQTATPADPSRSSYRYDNSQYMMENVYSTGEYAPEGVWTEPAPPVPLSDSHARTGRYETGQYMNENVYSTGDYAPAGAWREPIMLPTVDQTGREITPPPNPVTTEPYTYESTDPYQTGAAYSTGTASTLGPTWGTPGLTGTETGQQAILAAGGVSPLDQATAIEDERRAAQAQQLADYERLNADLWRYDQPVLAGDPLNAAMTGPEGGEQTLPDAGPSIPDQLGGWFNDRRNEAGVYLDTLGGNVQGELDAVGRRRDAYIDQLGTEAAEYLVNEPEAREAVQTAVEGDLIGLEDGLPTGYLPEAVQAADVLVTEQALKPIGQSFAESVLPRLAANWEELPEPVQVGGEFLGEKALQAATLAGDWNEERVGEAIYQYHVTGEEPDFYIPGLLTDVGVNQTDSETIRQVYEQGYNGYVGGQAVFAYLNDQEHPGSIVGTGVRALYDPVTAVTAAIPGLGQAKTVTTGLRAANPTSKALRAIDATTGAALRTAEVVDAATSLPFSLPSIGRGTARRIGERGRTPGEGAVPVNPGAATWPDPIDPTATWPTPRDEQFPEWAGTTRPPEPVPVDDPADIPVRAGQNAQTWRPEYSIGTRDPIHVTQTPDGQWMITESRNGVRQVVDTLADRDEAIRQAQIRMAERISPPTEVTGGVTTPPRTEVPITTRPAAAGADQPVSGGGTEDIRRGVDLRGIRTTSVGDRHTIQQANDGTFNVYRRTDENVREFVGNYYDEDLAIAAARQDLAQPGSTGADQPVAGGQTPSQVEADRLGPDGELLPTTRRTVAGTGEPATSPELQRTPGEGDVPTGDRLRRTLAATDEQAVSPEMQRTPGEGDVPPGDRVRRSVTGATVRPSQIQRGTFDVVDADGNTLATAIISESAAEDFARTAWPGERFRGNRRRTHSGGDPIQDRDFSGIEKTWNSAKQAAEDANDVAAGIRVIEDYAENTLGYGKRADAMHPEMRSVFGGEPKPTGKMVYDRTRAGRGWQRIDREIAEFESLWQRRQAAVSSAQPEVTGGRAALDTQPAETAARTTEDPAEIERLRQQADRQAARQLGPGEPPVPQELVDAMSGEGGTGLTRDLRDMMAAAEARQGTEAAIRGRVEASNRWLESIEETLRDFVARHGESPADPRLRRQLEQFTKQRDAMVAQRDAALRELNTTQEAIPAPRTGETPTQGVARQTAQEQPATAPQTAQETASPARTPELQQAPTRTNQRGESLSDPEWFPPDVRPRADEARQSRTIPIRVRAGRGLDKWRIDGKHPNHPDSKAMRDRMLREMQQPTMTTQRYDTAEARAWRAIMSEQGVMEHVPSQNPGYRTWLETVAPLVRKEPEMWNGRSGKFKGMFKRDNTNRHAVADARKVAARLKDGMPLDQAVDQVIRERFPTPGRSSVVGFRFDPTVAPAEWHEATRALRESGVPTIAGRTAREDDEQNIQGVQALENTIRTVLEQAAEVPGEFREDPGGTIGAGFSNLGTAVRAPLKAVNQGIGRWMYEEAVRATEDPTFQSVSGLIPGNAGTIRLIHEYGWVPETGEYAGQKVTGDQAVWEWMILQQPMWVQFAAEVLFDPLNVAGIFGRSITSIEKAPAAIKGVGKLLSAPDAAFNLATDAVIGAGSQLKHIGRIPIAGTPFRWLFDYSKETKAVQATQRFIDAANEIINAGKAPFGAEISSDAAKTTLRETFNDPSHPLAGKTWGDALADFTTEARAIQTEYSNLKSVAKPSKKQADRIKLIEEEWGFGTTDILAADPQELAAARTAIEVSLDHGLERGKPRNIVDILANGLVSDGVLHTPGGIHWGYSSRNLLGNPVKAAIQGESPLPFMSILKPGNFRKAIGAADDTHPFGQIGELSFVKTAREAGIGVPSRIGEKSSSFERAGGSSGFTQLMQRIGAGKLVTPGGKPRKFAPTTHAKALDEGMEAAQRALVWEKKFQQNMAKAANTRNSFIDETLRRTPRLRIPADDLAAAKRALPNGASPSDVATAMRDLALRHGATPALADDFAKTVGKRQANLTRQASEAAVRGVENVFVAFDPRNIDKIVGFTTNFHYWPSRAALDVGEAAMRSPRIISNFIAAKDGMEVLAQSDDPRVQGLVRVGSTIGGLALFANPFLALPMGFLMREAGDEMVPMGETTVGAFMREAGKFGVRGNWIVDGLANILGLQGDTFAPTFIPRKDVPMLEALGNFILTQMGADPIPPVVDQFTGEVREGVTRWLNERGFPIAVIEAGSETGYYEDKVASLIKEMHPELSTEEWDAAVTAGPGDPLWDEAARHLATMDLTTAAARSYSPVSLTARNLGRDEDIRLAREGRDAGPENVTPEQEQAMENRDIATRSPESKAWRDKVDGYNTLGTDRQRYLNDAMNAIGNADETMARPITVNGETYTRERLAAMDDSERWAIAYEWLETQGQGAADDYRAFQEERAAYRLENPGVQGLFEAARAYPGGRDAFIEDLRQRSPRYNAYIEDFNEEPGSDEWYRKALNASGYSMAIGNEWNVYDRDLPGDPTIAREVAQLEADRQEAQAERQAEFEERAQQETFGVTEQVRYFTRGIEERVAFIESWGMSPEDTQYVVDLYLNSAYGLTDEKLPYEIWDPLRDQFGSDYVYPKFFDDEYRGKARGYVQAKAQNPNLTLEQFLKEYKAQRKQEREAFDVDRDVLVPGR